MSRRIRRNEQLRVHSIAKKYQDDLRQVFSAFEQKGPSEWDVIGKFAEFLKGAGHDIKPGTIYDYLHRDIFPGWLNPLLCEFLSHDPYSSSPIVWKFVRDWMKPTAAIVEKIRARVEGERQKLKQEIEKFEKW